MYRLHYVSMVDIIKNWYCRNILTDRDIGFTIVQLAHRLSRVLDHVCLRPRSHYTLWYRLSLQQVNKLKGAFVGILIVAAHAVIHVYTATPPPPGLAIADCNSFIFKYVKTYVETLRQRIYEMNSRNCIHWDFLKANHLLCQDLWPTWNRRGERLHSDFSCKDNYTKQKGVVYI